MYVGDILNSTYAEQDRCETWACFEAAVAQNPVCLLLELACPLAVTFPSPDCSSGRCSSLR